MKIKLNEESRKKTPWDDVFDATPTQEFIMNKYNENYKNKHPNLNDTNEAELINSVEVKTCPYCNYVDFIKYGKTNNHIIRYYCNQCKKTFTPLTGTIFENHKISITEWIEFCLDLLNYGSITLSSKVNKNSFSTSKYWLNKLFLILKTYQEDIILKDRVYIDETYYSVIFKERIIKDDKLLRGISENKYCIGIGCDDNNVIAFLEGKSKPSIKKTKQAFIYHITIGSTLVHDDEKSHNVLVEELGLIDERYNSKELKNLKDKDNPLNKINKQCFLLKRFLNAHSGFAREDLQNYLNLFCFINNKPKNKLEKVEKLLNLALTTRVTLRYRDLFHK